MTDKNNLGAFDRFRLAAAVLVIAIHTSPLWSVNETCNFLLTGVFARIAVPFFFAITGYFADFKSAARIGKLVVKTLSMYAAAIVIYLPFGTYSSTLKMLLFDGAFFHLWYFPACVAGALIVFALKKLPKIPAFAAAGALYIVGVFGDSYYGLTEGLTHVRAVYEFLSGIFSYTRNGLFFAPLFMLIGDALSERRLGENRFGAGTGLALSLTLLTVERVLLKDVAVSPHDNMTFSLIPVTVCLFEFLASFKMKPRPGYRKAAMWVYILHPIAGYWVRELAVRFGAEDFSARYSLAYFAIVTVLSFAAAFVIETVKTAVVGLDKLRCGATQRIN
ncbi:MAG: acyltransferase [Ruminococcaceae bacterium]|nr:acyltransferase [Oscillospiraceae bacterium]